MPEGRIVVVNTTPILSLAMIRQLGLLRDLYTEVFIPPAVRAEIQAGGSDAMGVRDIEEAFWVRTMELKDPRRAELLSDLDRGEAEVIALSQEIGAHAVVIDEKLARAHARRLGLPLTGTLGVLLKAKKAGRLPLLRPLIEQLIGGGVWISPALVAESLKLAGE